MLHHISHIRHYYLEFLSETNPTHSYPLSYRALRVHKQQMFCKSVVHSCQYVGPWVGSACADEKVSFIFKQFLSISATHFAMVPCLALQLFLRAEGKWSHQQGAWIVHRCCLVKIRHLALGLALRRWLGLGLNGFLKGLWYRWEQCQKTRENVWAQQLKIHYMDFKLYNFKSCFTVNS